jgi:hypothetical protein
MLQRTLHSIGMFVAIFVAYRAYVLALVPWIEPPLVVRPALSVDIEPGDPSVGSVSRYQRVLAAYFPADHWSLMRPPKVIENESGSVMFVLDDYERHDDGRVDLSHFALLIFPTARQPVGEPPRDAVVLEAPQGAKLQFDKNFRPERGEVGAIQHGEFPGKITIRSDMRDPGPEDDLLIETTDLEMNSTLLYTQNEVRFRLGPNVGGGREMEIRLQEEETAKARAGLKIVSVQSLEIFREVRLRLHLGTKSLLPGHGDEVDAEKDQEAAKGKGPAALLGDASKPPVEVTCKGPFHFDFIKYIAGFDKDVEVWQVNPDGPADQLSCDKLDLCFARKQDALAPPPSADLEGSNRQRADVRWLEPDRVIAEGYPVRITSPSRQAEVRGRRVQLLLRQRKVAIEGGDDVSIAYGPNVLKAPNIQYQDPGVGDSGVDAGTKIGTFRAFGPGTLNYTPDPTKPDQVFQAEWQASVELGRFNGQPVLTVAGRPRMMMTNVGMLTADQVRVFLREVEVDGKTQPLPDRMNAVGQVEINSPQLLARTRQLTANFRVEDPAPATAGAPGAEPQQNGLAHFNLDRDAGPAERQYQVQSDEMQLEVAMRGKRAAPKTLACNGHVAFRELPNAQNSTGEPLEVSGEQLIAEHLDTAALVTIRGTAPQAGVAATDAALAQIRARGMTVHAADVKLDVGKNRLWIDGPGVANMLLKRSIAGGETPTPTPLELDWQGGLVFDGRTIVVDRGVAIDGPDDHLRCDRLSARLTSDVNFGKRVDQDAIDVEIVECSGRVAMDHRSRDEKGITSHERMELEQLAINQQTGAINGRGPGVIRSTRYGDAMPGLATPGSAPNPLPSSDAKLHFLRVDFQQGLTGNFINREITFQTRVRTVYGPVDAWEQELDGNRPESLPPDTMTLTSDSLRVNEDPLTANHRSHDAAAATNMSLVKVQMLAEGNVNVEGQSPKQGAFSAMAERLAYSQYKQQLILEGSPRVLAKIRYSDPASGQMIENAAMMIMYDITTGLPALDGARSLEVTPGTGSGAFKNALGPFAPRQ